MVGVTKDCFITGGGGFTIDCIYVGFTLDWLIFLFSPGWITLFYVSLILIWDYLIVTFFVWLTFKLLLFVYGTFTGGFYGDVTNLDSAIFPGRVVWFIAGFMFDYCGFFISLWVINGFFGSYCFVTVELTIGWGLGYVLGSDLGYCLA